MTYKRLSQSKINVRNDHFMNQNKLLIWKPGGTLFTEAQEYFNQGLHLSGGDLQYGTYGGPVMTPEAHSDKWLTPRATNPGCLVLCWAPAEWLLFSHFRPAHSSSPRRVFSLWSIITSNGLCNWMRIIHWRLLMGSAHQDVKRAVQRRVGGGGWVWDGSRGPAH